MAEAVLRFLDFNRNEGVMWLFLGFDGENERFPNLNLRLVGQHTDSPLFHTVARTLGN